jgi:hypothetical protein
MSSTRILGGAAVFLSAFLLFLVEPMVAKQLLPALGGSSAVWMTCLVFFQVTLLLGYLYAHWLTSRSTQGGTMRLHLALISLALLTLAVPLLVHRDSSGLLVNGYAHPVTTIFAALSLTIGVPFLLLASTSPLLQVWLARAADGRIDYRLFALSNVGSLLALAAYPTLVEPYLTLRVQRIMWLIGFTVYSVVAAILALRTDAAPLVVESQPANIAPAASARDKLLWFLLPMVAAMQLSAVTSHLTINIAAIPLLWILPLAVYLLTFILAFEFPGLYRRAIIVRLLVVMLASLGYTLSRTDVSFPIGISILFYLAEAFFACLFCHAEAYAIRPQRTSETTLFYLFVAAGGAAGTFFIGIASPLIFTANYDLPISFTATALLALVVTWRDGWAQRLLWATGSVLLLYMVVMVQAAYHHNTIFQIRNFYGSLRVKQVYPPTHPYPVRTLLNGTIQHGTQMFTPELNGTPTTYYGADSGIGLALRGCCDTRARNIGVVGLGAGTLAAYGHPGDRIRFYEINPAVEPIARNLFTYIRNSQAQITIASGDARASLAREAPQQFDVLVVDAFSGDAIPIHLLTKEALALYRRHLAPGGVLALHVSNQYLDLGPQIAALAASAGMSSRYIDSLANDERGEFTASWVLVTNNTDFLSRDDIVMAATPLPATNLRAWTDDYSSLLPILQWKHE